MRLVIEDIYSPAGRKALAEAYTKSFWANKVHHQSWLGVPQLQIPEDVIALGEVIWTLKPSLIIECGIWEGGGLIFYSSMLQLIGHGNVMGVDVNVSKAAALIRGHPMEGRVKLLQGSSVDPAVLNFIRDQAKGSQGHVLVILDSNHTAQHVRAELEAYHQLIRPGGYLVAMDGIMNILYDVPGGDPSWRTDNPETAVAGFLQVHSNFKRDLTFDKLGMSYAPGGFLRRIS